MMRTVDRRLMLAPIDRVFAAAADVARWPEWLPHYRRVHLTPRPGLAAVVEMAAWRPFGPFNWPTWWTSEMWVDRSAPSVRYRHIRGITTGMDVEWGFSDNAEGTVVTIVHEWKGPAWPVIGRAAAEWVIGPIFVHGIASRTLRGIAAIVERPDA